MKNHLVTWHKARALEDHLLGTCLRYSPCWQARAPIGFLVCSYSFSRFIKQEPNVVEVACNSVNSQPPLSTLASGIICETLFY